MNVLGIWWVWVAAAVVLMILETVAPVFIFLGMAIGAGLVGLSLAFGVAGFASPGVLILAFASLSLVAAILLRLVLGVRKGQVKTWDTDINE